MSTASSDRSDSILLVEPILNRLDRIEARLSAVEARPVQAVQQTKDIIQSMLETVLGPRIEDLRARLHAEMLESVDATLTRFEQTIDSKVSLRIAIIEKALTDQSAMITALSQREIESDGHLQQLISAVERLCERTDERSLIPTPAKEPPFRDLPFETQLGEAMERQAEPVPDQQTKRGLGTLSTRWQPTAHQ
jgi:hypothetical protein